MNEIEIWKPITFTSGDYEASSLGRIRRATAGNGTYAGRILSPGRSKKRKDAYFNVTIVVNGKSISRGVHTLVCDAFHGPKPDGHIVGHKDDNPANNVPDNLEWITYSQNMKQAFDRGRKFSSLRIPEIHKRSIETRKRNLEEHPELRLYGEQSPRARYSNAFVAEVRQCKIDHPELTIRQIAAKYNLNLHTCRNWMFGFHRKHG